MLYCTIVANVTEIMGQQSRSEEHLYSVRNGKDVQKDVYRDVGLALRL